MLTDNASFFDWSQSEFLLFAEDLVSVLVLTMLVSFIGYRSTKILLLFVLVLRMLVSLI